MTTFIKAVYAITVSLVLIAGQAQASEVYNKCISCHGDKAMGSETAPRLAGQHEWYINTSFEKFNSGDRPDVNGIHKKISANDAKAVAAFLANLK